MRRKKALPKRVICKFDNNKDHKFEKIIEIPNGWKFLPGRSWERLRLVDEEGKVRKEFDWQAGYSMEYEYIYEV